MTKEILLSKIKWKKLKKLYNKAHCIHGYARKKDGEYAIITKTASKIIPSLYRAGKKIILQLHAPRGKRDVEALKKAYAEWWHMVDLVVFDNKSPDGVRSWVRFHGFKVRRKIVKTCACVYDDDYSQLRKLFDTGEKKNVSFKEFMIVCWNESLAARKDGLLMISPAEDSDFMHSGDCPESTGRSGMFIEHHDLIDACKPVNWNAFKDSMIRYLVTNEDIVSTGKMLERGEFRVFRTVAVIGERFSNGHMDVQTAICASAVLEELPWRMGINSLKTKFYRKYNYNLADYRGWLYSMAEAGRTLKKKHKIKRLSFSLRKELWDTAFNIDTGPKGDGRFAPVYLEAIKKGII